MSNYQGMGEAHTWIYVIIIIQVLYMSVIF